MTDKVLTEFADGIALITLNRPEARNAVDLEVAEAGAAVAGRVAGR